MLNHSNAKSQSSKEYFPFVKVSLYLFPFSHYFFWEIENFHLKINFFSGVPTLDLSMMF